MKLHSQAFERALVTGVREAVRNNPAVRKEFRRVNRLHLRNRGRWLRFLLALVLADFVWGVFHTTHHMDSALVAIDLWMLLWFLIATQRLVHLPFRSRDIIALRFFPVTDATIFHWEWGKFFKGSFGVLGDIIVGLSTLGLMLHLSPGAFLALVALAPVTWAMTLGWAALGAARWPSFPYGATVGGVVFLGAIAFFAHKLVGRAYLRFLDDTSPFINLFLPTGWPLSLSHLVLRDGFWNDVVLILPIGLILWSFPDSLRRLQERYQYREWFIPQAPDIVPGAAANETGVDEGSDQLSDRFMGVTAISEGISSGRFLEREDWSNGWLEAKLWRWFSDREKTLAEFAFPKGLLITRPWKIFARNFLITFILGVAAGWASHYLKLWIFGIGTLIVFGRAGASLLNNGAAFRQIRNGGVSIPLYAAYPITYRELSRVLIKCSLVQVPLFVALMTILLAYVMASIGQGWERGVLMGIKAGIVLCGARLLMLVLAYSSATSDTSRFRFRTAAKVGFFMIGGAAYCLLAGAGILIQFEWLSWLICGAAVLLGYAVYRLYGWIYHAIRFDTMQALH